MIQLQTDMLRPQSLVYAMLLEGSGFGRAKHTGVVRAGRNGIRPDAWEKRPVGIKATTAPSNTHVSPARLPSSAPPDCLFASTECVESGWRLIWLFQPKQALAFFSWQPWGSTPVSSEVRYLEPSRNAGKMCRLWLVSVPSQSAFAETRKE